MSVVATTWLTQGPIGRMRSLDCPKSERVEPRVTPLRNAACGRHAGKHGKLRLQKALTDLSGLYLVRVIDASPLYLIAAGYLALSPEEGWPLRTARAAPKITSPCVLISFSRFPLTTSVLRNRKRCFLDKMDLFLIPRFNASLSSRN